MRDRITALERRIEALGASRQLRRKQRNDRGLPVLSIVGYTNAGKSTLLNALTDSAVLAEDKLFATLDPTSRRLRFPRDREVIITDTVGFIRDLPPDLVNAFRATLEELADADLLLHVVDAVRPAARRADRGGRADPRRRSASTRSRGCSSSTRPTGSPPARAPRSRTARRASPSRRRRATGSPSCSTGATGSSGRTAASRSPTSRRARRRARTRPAGGADATNDDTRAPLHDAPAADGPRRGGSALAAGTRRS